MSEDKKNLTKSTTHAAIKKLYTEHDGLVNKGSKCTCTAKEAELFKKVKAI